MNLHNVALIIRREYLQRLKSPGFIVGTILGILAVVALVFLPSLISLLDQPTNTKVAIVDPQNIVYSYLPIQTGPTPTAVPSSTAQPTLSIGTGIQFVKADSSDETALAQRVNSGDISAYVVVSGTTASTAGFIYHAKDRPNGTVSAQLAALLTAALTQAKLQEFGITPQQAQSLFSSPVLKVEPIVGTTFKDERIVFQSTALVYVLLIFLYITILMYGIQVAMGVVEEKSSRIMEILVTAVRPVELMMGKVVGIGLAGLTQTGLVVAAAFLLLLLSSPLGSTLSGLGIDISLVPAGTLVAFLIFFILGYLLFAALYGAFGSLVSRTEDVNGITGPLTLVMVGVYFVAIAALAQPDADFVRWLSFVPFFTPMLMFLRVALGTPAFWEVVLSIVLLSAAILLFTWLAAKIYRVGVLLYGKRPSFREIVRLLRTT